MVRRAQMTSGTNVADSKETSSSSSSKEGG
jgi:hypothetical protein